MNDKSTLMLLASLSCIFASLLLAIHGTDVFAFKPGPLKAPPSDEVLPPIEQQEGQQEQEQEQQPPSTPPSPTTTTETETTDIIQQDGSSATSYRFEGLDLYELGRYEEAIQAYDKAIAIDPENEEVYLNKGVSLSNLNRTEEELQMKGNCKVNLIFKHCSIDRDRTKTSGHCSIDRDRTKTSGRYHF